MGKRVLIITYYWPPAGGISVLRCLKFSKYLKSFGWDVTVYKPSNAHYPSYDEDNFKDIDDEIEILEQPIREPFGLFNFFSGRKKNENSNPVYSRNKKVSVIDNLAIWIRGNFFIPDARFLWIKPSVRYLKNYLKNHPVDVLLTDGPPHTNTVIACKLSMDLNIPWLADFQDPWTQVDYYKMFRISWFADRIHKKMEQDVFNVAKRITIASPTWGKELEAIGAKSTEVVYWGYDEEDFIGLENRLDNKFSIYHAGILGFDRNPITFFKVLNELKDEVDGFAGDLEIKLAGSVDYKVIEQIEKENLKENLCLMGFVKRRQALKNAMNARVLLLPINQAENARGRIPGKLFELMRAGRPILGLGVLDSDVQTIILKSHTGNYFDYDDKTEIKKFILYKYREFKEGKDSGNKMDVEEYSIENQTKKVSNLLSEII